jgi:hypothetical protein
MSVDDDDSLTDADSRQVDLATTRDRHDGS